MQQLLANLFKKTLVILLVGFISISSFAVSSQPSFAATSTMQEMDSQTISERERAYEEQLEAEKNPDKVFAENIKEYNKENPGENIIEKAVEGAEKAVEKVTGKN